MSDKKERCQHDDLEDYLDLLLDQRKVPELYPVSSCHTLAGVI